MILAIHQPNFFPWWPYFEKIEQADVFVFLTHCQFEKNGYQNRFNCKDNWYTMSVKKGMKPITDKEYLNPENDWDRIKSNLPEHKDFLDMFDHFMSEDLMLTNLKVINNVVKLFDIDTELTIDYETDLRSTERLVDICCARGADKYLAGIGSKEYLNESLFEDRGIEVIYQDVKEPVHTLETL